MSGAWRRGNGVRLLVNGEQYYPRVFAAIERAEREVLLETFILFDDVVGAQLRSMLIAAARRGVRVVILLDGFGSARLSREFVGGLVAAGVRVQVFDPGKPLFGWRLNPFRRLHRKQVVVDGRTAFIGGLNFAADHLDARGARAQQDYAVELTGSIVTDMREFLHAAMDTRDSQVAPQSLEDFAVAIEPATLARVVDDPETVPALQPDADGDAEIVADDVDVRLVVRDNRRHRTDIERGYRDAIAAAEHELILANAYFFPGYLLLREIRRAARRGVEVHLILQGEPDEPLAMYAARLLYRSLISDGVHVHEYCRRAFHGKVAVIDRRWATVGSSNLDPLSLSLNLEANVFLRSAELARGLAEHLLELADTQCRHIDAARFAGRPTMWHSLRNTVVFHVLRRFPAWAGLLPAHLPRIASVGPRPAADPSSSDSDAAPM